MVFRPSNQYLSVAKPTRFPPESLLLILLYQILTSHQANTLSHYYRSLSPPLNICWRKISSSPWCFTHSRCLQLADTISSVLDCKMSGFTDGDLSVSPDEHAIIIGIDFGTT